MTVDAQQVVLLEIERLLDPVRRAAESARGREELFATLGWDLDAITGFPIARLQAALEQCRGAVDAVAALVDPGPASLEDVAIALGQVESALSAIRDLAEVLDGTSVTAPPEFALLGSDLISTLTITYLQRFHPRVYAVAELLTLIEPPPEDRPEPALLDATSQAIVRRPLLRPRLRLERIGRLLSDPVAELKDAYIGAEGLLTTAQAELAADRLFPRIARLLRSLGADAVYGVKPQYGLDFGPGGNAMVAHMLSLYMPLDLGPDLASSGVGVTFALSSEDQGGAALVAAPFGRLAFARAFSAWVLELALSGGIGGFAVGPGGLRLPSGVADTSVQLAAGIARIASDGAAGALLGSAKGTRLEVGRLALTSEAGLTGGVAELGFMLDVESAAIVVAAGDGDGFLQKILPPEGVRTEFDLALGWSNERGLYFRGSAGLEATLPIGQDVLGVLRIETAHVSLHPEGDVVRAWVGATVGVQLGPIKAAVEELGLEAILSFPENGGNLGAAHVVLKFKPPRGAGLVIDVGVVVGGGYLIFDPERELYAGAVQLEIAETLSLTGFGLLNTRMPDGSRGFSLLVLIAVRFLPPVQLGYGFTLNGVGGLLGLNRTVALEPLREGLRNGTMGSILFPEDPIRNAPRILSDLQMVFPPAEGRFLFGPMAILGWGTPTLLTLELGLVLELPAPVRLFILGRLRVLLPEQRAAIVRLQLDALGVVDFERGDVALDAVLYDSQIAQFEVTGEMALRASWGANPFFVLAVGGFHPSFQAPPAFPALERVAISLAIGDNPRLRLEAYLAVTTNTVQFGAHLDLYASAGPFSIEGYLGFDVLLQFDPFGLVAELAAGLALKYNGRSVMSVELQVTLTGPTPWHAYGQAHFRVLFISGSIGFDVQVGEPPPERPLPPSVDLKDLLLKELAKPGNWATQVPRAEHPLVSVRDRPGAVELLVHPLAELQVSQRTLPLAQEISRFGNATPAAERYFTLSAELGGAAAGVPSPDGAPVEDYFAPSQFREMTDDEKLMAPAFERMCSGMRFSTRRYTCGPATKEEEMLYERKTIYGRQPGTTAVRAAAVVAAATTPGPSLIPTAATVPVTERPAPVVLPSGYVQRVASGGAAGLAAIGVTGNARYRVSGEGVTLKPPSFVAVVGSGAAAGATIPPLTARPADGGLGAAVQGYSAAVAALQAHLRAHPDQRGRARVVPVPGRRTD